MEVYGIDEELYSRVAYIELSGSWLGLAVNELNLKNCRGTPT